VVILVNCILHCCDDAVMWNTCVEPREIVVVHDEVVDVKAEELV
jgi:hypothetical protein